MIKQLRDSSGAKISIGDPNGSGLGRLSCSCFLAFERVGVVRVTCGDVMSPMGQCCCLTSVNLTDASAFEKFVSLS